MNPEPAPKAIPETPTQDGSGVASAADCSALREYVESVRKKMIDERFGELKRWIASARKSDEPSEEVIRKLHVEVMKINSLVNNAGWAAVVRFLDKQNVDVDSRAESALCPMPSSRIS